MLTTVKTRTYKTQIFDQVKRGPNFAGHFTVAKWGCGSACLAFVVVDSRTGNVFDPGFTVGCADKTKMEAAIEFRVRSRLLIATGFSEGLGCGRSYYEWNGRTLNVIYFKPWNYGHRSHRTVQLPRYMTDIPQPIPEQIKPQDAPNTARNIECFRSFTHESSMIDVVRKCGIPDEHQGSGIASCYWHSRFEEAAVREPHRKQRVIFIAALTDAKLGLHPAYVDSVV